MRSLVVCCYDVFECEFDVLKFCGVAPSEAFVALVNAKDSVDLCQQCPATRNSLKASNVRVFMVKVAVIKQV